MREFCDVTVVLDRSGSMQSMRDDAIGGFNSFVEEQRKIPGDGCWSLVQFDDQYETVFAGKPQNEVPRLTRETFVPRGSTAMVDAVCRTIDETGLRLSRLPESERPSKVMVIVITDGQENASKTFRTHHLHERITHQREKYGWQFLFLAATQDAIATAAQYGIPQTSAMSWVDQNVGGALVAANRATRSWKTEGNDSADNLFIDPVRDVKVNVSVAAR